MTIRPAWLTSRRVAIAASLVLGASYLAAVPGPLRLDTDSASLLRLGASVADGTGLHPPGSQSFPPGYPVLVAAIDTLGIAGGPAFVLVGIGFLALALVASFVTTRVGLGLTPTEAAVVVMLTTLSVYVVKNTAMPLTEIPFFGVAAAAVAALTLARSRASLRWLAAGVVLAVLACTIRTAGVALAPAVVLALPSLRGRLAAAAVALVGVLAAIASAPHYVGGLDRWVDTPLHTAGEEGYRFLRTTGAPVVNIPISSWGGLSEPITVVAGIVALALVAWIAWTRRRRLSPVDGWLIGTLGMILVYTGDHPRFMIPILPVLFGYGALAARRRARLGHAYSVAFAAIGAAALCYSTVLAYSGHSFPERYARGTLAETYRVAWQLDRPGDLAEVDERVLWALRRYDPDPPGLP